MKHFKNIIAKKSMKTWKFLKHKKKLAKMFDYASIILRFVSILTENFQAYLLTLINFMRKMKIYRNLKFWKKSNELIIIISIK